MDVRAVAKQVDDANDVKEVKNIIRGLNGEELVSLSEELRRSFRELISSVSAVRM